MKILLIDDDVFLRDMYATKFNELGHTITAVETGAEALSILKTESFDSILLDMFMPGMSGIEILKKIHEMALPTMPICIVLSNQGGKEEIEEAELAGANGYIIKAEHIPSEVVEEVMKIVQKQKK